MRFDSIILDIDGTIWNTTEIVAQAWNKAIAENFPMVPAVSAEILKTQFGKTMKVIADNLFFCLNDEQKDVLMKKCCEMEQLYLSRNEKDLAYPGVIKTIHELSRVVPLFIVSNCQKGYIDVVISKNKIEKDITDSECYGNNGNNKDENIRLIVERNQLKNPVYVGDTHGDMEACKKSGVPFIFASYGFGTADEFYAKIEAFEELKQFVF
ncbi:MAG: HAD family hydrolase [Treponema sp.]|nr:HAD family hydrolase [Treponema sp.]